MRILLILPAIFAVTTAQGLFGGFGGGFPNVGLPNVGLPNVGLPNVGLPNLPSIPLLDNVQNFGDFVAQTGKSYASAAEQTLREGIFAAKKAFVDANNQAYNLGNSAFKLGVNAFSDLSKAEFLSKLTGYKRSSEGDAKAQAHRKKTGSAPKQNIPDSFDWREKGGVTPVKFQGLECNACWSFAVTGALEGHHFRKTKSLVTLSEQNLIDCSANYGNTGCGGGYQEYGFEYIIENKGLAGSDKYPYEMKDGKCYYKNDLKSAGIKEFGVIEPKNEKQMKEIIATLGPLACSINAGADSFQLYKEGIYDDEECNKEEVNHSVLVVGYGSEKGKDYWIVKNSWTDKWGEAGYVRIPRNKNSFCGIASECSYPIL